MILFTNDYYLTMGANSLDIQLDPTAPVQSYKQLDVFFILLITLCSMRHCRLLFYYIKCLLSNSGEMGKLCINQIQGPVIRVHLSHTKIPKFGPFMKDPELIYTEIISVKRSIRAINNDHMKTGTI